MTYVPFLIIIIISILLILLYVIILNKSEKYETVKLMSDIENVPTISLTEKSPNNILNKVIFGGKKKVDFEIKSNPDNFKLKIANYSDYLFSGKGLVIAANGIRYRYITGLYSNLFVIRNYLKSNIPIEIFYVGKEEEFSPEIYKLINDLGNIKIVNLLDRINTNVPINELKGYQTKPLAVLCSSFEDVVLLDADALCFIDPANLFSADGFESGMILFRDYVNCTNFISKDFLEYIGIGKDKYCSKTDNYEIDSSCVVLNKKKCWETLYTICIINVKSDSYHKSKNVLGDKDTWIIACMLLNSIDPYIAPPKPEIFVKNNKVILGHLQATNFSNKKVYTHYNNQMIDLLSIEPESLTITEVKNPSVKNTVIYNSYEVPENILFAFNFAKQGLKQIIPLIPKHMIPTTFNNGVSKGLIP